MYMKTPTPCCWYGMPSLPLNEATITEDWALGECTLHVYGPLGVLEVRVSGATDQDWWPRDHFEIEVDLSADCELLTTKGQPFGHVDIPGDVLTALERQLRKLGHQPDGPVEFARKATGEQRELALEWAREQEGCFDEADEVLAMLEVQDPDVWRDSDVEPSDPWNPSYEPMRLAAIEEERHWLERMVADDDDNRPLGMKARQAI